MASPVWKSRSRPRPWRLKSCRRQTRTPENARGTLWRTEGCSREKLHVPVVPWPRGLGTSPPPGRRARDLAEVYEGWVRCACSLSGAMGWQCTRARVLPPARTSMGAHTWVDDSRGRGASHVSVCGRGGEPGDGGWVRAQRSAG